LFGAPYSTPPGTHHDLMDPAAYQATLTS